MASVKAALAHLFSFSTWHTISGMERRLFIGIMAVHFLLSGWFITRLGFTSDETGYYGFAVRWAQGNQERISPVDDSKTPIVAPALLPIAAKKWLSNPADKHGFALLQAGRWCMYVFQFLGACIMLFWLYRLWGAKKWILPLLLYLFDPLIFSYGMIVGSDLASAVLLFATFYFAWRYWNTHQNRYWIWMSVACSIAIVAKASMIYIVPLLVLLFLLAGKKSASEISYSKPWNTWQRWMLLFASVLFVINMAYYFQGSFFSIQHLPQRSGAFQKLATQFSWLGNFPIPFPYSYVSGFDYLTFNKELGGGDKDINSFLGVFILGNYYTRGPVWYYYLATALFKLPLFTWVMMSITSWWIFKSKKVLLLLRKHIFIWLPACCYFFILSFTNPFQIGIRHALLIFPFLYLGISYAVLFVYEKWRKTFRVIMVLHVLSLLSFWPNMIAYTNELILNKAMVYRYLYDSSVVYGNAPPYLKRFLKLHPEYTIPTATPAPGKYAIDLESVASPLNTYGLQWLHKNFAPTGHYMQVILLYEISPEDVKSIR